MKKVFYYAILVATLTIGCSHDDDKIVIVGADYFPLQTGNYWRYENTVPQGNPTLTEITVIGTKMFEGKSFFEVCMHSLTTDFSDTMYYRVDENAYVLARRRNSTEEEERYHLHAKKDESWHTYESGNGIMTFNDFSPVIFNSNLTINNCRNYSYDDPRAVDEEWNAVLAPGIGLIQSSSLAWGTRMRIVEAKINGVKMVFE